MPARPVRVTCPTWRDRPVAREDKASAPKCAEAFLTPIGTRQKSLPQWERLNPIIGPQRVIFCQATLIDVSGRSGEAPDQIHADQGEHRN